MSINYGTAKSAVPENPYAFPIAETDHSAMAEGMTLLDYFAGQALPGIITNDAKASSAIEMARSAYVVATAMLMVRQERMDQ